jgi:heat shock protein HslJ
MSRSSGLRLIPLQYCAAVFLSLAALGLAACAPEAGPEGEPTVPEQNLIGTEWWVEDIEGGGVIDNSHTTIAFPEAGRVAGDGGCNRYMGPVEIDGDRMSFGPLAGTLMACPEALMNQDRKFHQALGKVAQWEIRETGLLHLLDAEGATVVRAWKVEQGSE